MAQPQVNFGNYPLKDIPGPHPHDVLCGRGGGTNNHVGNSHWRMLVAANKQLYVTLPKRQKMLLSRSIVNAVRSQNPPGRFLQKDAKSELWYDVGDQRAQEKTSQALREGAPDIRQKLTKGETSPTEESTTASTTGVTAPENSNSSTGTATQPVPSTATSATPPPQSHPPVVPPTSTPAVMMPPVTTPLPVPGIAAAAAPPGSTPVMVYAMSQNGMPGVPMYQALMTPEGTMVPNSMHGLPNANMSSIPPPFPATIPPQGPTSNTNNNNTKDSTSELMPPPANQSPSQSHNNYAHAAAQAPGPGDLEPISEYDQAAMMTGALEPSGISFGSVSMMSVGNSKLEAAGTSFGSMMSFTVASTKAPGMVDGGLEPIGTSFGSLSLNSVDQNQLQQALSGEGHKQPANSNSFATPTLLSQQRSQGNLLECSDTESEDEEEEATPNGGSKSVEWEKLKRMLEAHTNMDQGQSADTPPGQQHYQHFQQQQSGQYEQQQQQQQQYEQNQQQQFDELPPTGFYENISALSMGDFGDDFDEIVKQAYSNDAMPPPPPMNSKQDDDGLTNEEREQIQLMMLAQGGGLGFPQQNSNNSNGNGR
jgi:hypothetical protein